MEESRAEPDQAMLARTIAARAALVAEREALAVDDESGITKILTACCPIALRLNCQEG